MVIWSTNRTENLFCQVIDVNLIGTIRVTKAFVAMIRKSQGRIVNVSSTLGRQTGPFMSGKLGSGEKSSHQHERASMFLFFIFFN